MTCRLFLVSPTLTTAIDLLINVSDPQTFQICFPLPLSAPLCPDLSTSLQKPSFVFDFPLKRKVVASAPTNLILIVLQCSTLILTSRGLAPILTLQPPQSTFEPFCSAPGSYQFHFPVNSCTLTLLHSHPTHFQYHKTSHDVARHFRLPCR